MAKEGEHLNTEKPMKTQELLNTMEGEEGGTTPSDDEDESDGKNDSSSDSNSNDSGHDDDDSNSRSYDSPYSGDDWGEPPSDKEDKDVDLFYEEYGSDVDYYDEVIKDGAEANRWSDIDNDQYMLINVLENAREENAQANEMYHDKYPYRHLSDWSDITNVSSRSSPRTEEDESKHFPQPTYLGNRGMHDLFDEWMDNIEHLDAFVTDKPIDVEIEEEATDYMDVDPPILMLREE
ncbi:hypothetical protein SO802_031635 [Lithocarpus litseifolius]|uniref:Uncharacterized protein n=1 Tax=Lithocarpus litseifolius TaxID=425828 RepID=A0AAW2BP51_9ROSI